MKPTGVSVAKDDGGDSGEKFTVGKVYEVKLTTGIEFKGIVLTHDADSNIVIFEEGTKTKPGNIKKTRMVKESSISDLNHLPKTKDPIRAKNRWIDLDELLAKEKLAIRELKGEERIDVSPEEKREIKGERIDVSPEAQSIFDALSEEFEVKWNNSVILMSNNVCISSPYRSNCVTGGTTLARKHVKSVLAEARKKWQLQ